MVISNRPGVYGLKRASLAGIQTRVNAHLCSLVARFIEGKHSTSIHWRKPLSSQPTSVSLETQVVDHKLYGSRAEFDATINGVLEEFGVELVCLAGFMRILTGTFVKKWNGTSVLLFNAV